MAAARELWFDITRAALLESTWYNGRLKTRQQHDIALWTRHIDYLTQFTSNPHNAGVATRMDRLTRKSYAAVELKRVSSPKHLQAMVGMLGTDLFGTANQQ